MTCTHFVILDAQGVDFAQSNKTCAVASQLWFSLFERQPGRLRTKATSIGSDVFATNEACLFHALDSSLGGQEGAFHQQLQHLSRCKLISKFPPTRGKESNSGFFRKPRFSAGRRLFPKTGPSFFRSLQTQVMCPMLEACAPDPAILRDPPARDRSRLSKKRQISKTCSVQ